MKRIRIGIMMVALFAMTFLTGCRTSGRAFTKITATDGTVTESGVEVIGTGDKASSVMLEGLFADGAPGDLGAGVGKANATQQSTGIDGSLKGMGEMFGGMAQLMAVMQTGGFIGAPKATTTIDTGIDTSGPFVRVFLNGRQIDQFNPSGMSQEDIAIRAGCTTGNCAPGVDRPPGTGN